MPKTLGKCKLTPLQTAFMRNGPLLCLKWVGQKMKSKKKPVTILTMIHEANEVLTRKKIHMAIGYPNHCASMSTRKICQG